MTTAELRKIRRNSTERTEMWEHATRAISYTLDNCFIGQDVTVEGAKAWYDRISGSHKSPDVTWNGKAYVIHYHSNHWTELLCPPSRDRV